MIFAIDTLLRVPGQVEPALQFLNAFDRLVEAVLFDLSSLMIVINGAYRSALLLAYCALECFLQLRQSCSSMRTVTAQVRSFTTSATAKFAKQSMNGAIRHDCNSSARQSNVGIWLSQRDHNNYYRTSLNGTLSGTSDFVHDQGDGGRRAGEAEHFCLIPQQKQHGTGKREAVMGFFSFP